MSASATAAACCVATGASSRCASWRLTLWISFITALALSSSPSASSFWYSSVLVSSCVSSAACVLALLGRELLAQLFVLALEAIDAIAELAIHLVEARLRDERSILRCARDRA
jgi:hypothetical protein